ncbi:hypothetical protein L9F63_011534 [Diploptera punctata]|uniref:Uncharacterized protein n=1 Tax=Diploptera punctata TaxID=6984 RepID=A0AAD8AH00_DIPPU|nr:hypothetical protein L9F63_011534 [Diploptera punctata]
MIQMKKHSSSKMVATSHTANVSMGLLRLAFPGRLISKNGDIPWPPRSPDLTVPDFFLWGYLKCKVFEENAPRTKEDLKERIRQEINNIPLQMLQNAMGGFHLRLQHVCKTKDVTLLAPYSKNDCFLR